MDDQTYKHSFVLFVGDDGTPMRFYMRPCLTKIRLKPLIEHGGGCFANILKPDVIRLVEKGSASASLCVGGKELNLFSTYIDDCVKKNCRLPFDNYIVKVSTYEVSDFSQTQEESAKKKKSKSTRANHDVPVFEQKTIDFLLEHSNAFITLSSRSFYLKMKNSGLSATHWGIHKTINTIYSNIDTYNIETDKRKKLKKLFSQKKQVQRQSLPDEIEILKYIDDNNRYKDLNNSSLWEEIGNTNVTKHDAQTARRIFWRRLMKDIYDFDLPLSQIKKLNDHVGAQNTDPDDEFPSIESVQKPKKKATRTLFHSPNIMTSVSSRSSSGTSKLSKKAKLVTSPKSDISKETTSLANAPTRHLFTPHHLASVTSRSGTRLQVLKSASDVSPQSDVSYRTAIESPSGARTPLNSNNASFHSTLSDGGEQKQTSPSILDHVIVHDDLMVQQEVEVNTSKNDDINMFDSTTVALPLTTSSENIVISETPSNQLNQKASQQSSQDSPIPNSAWLDSKSDSESRSSFTLNTNTLPNINRQDWNSRHSGEESISLSSTDPKLIADSQDKVVDDITVPKNAGTAEVEILNELQDGDEAELDHLPLLSQPNDGQEEDVPSASSSDEMEMDAFDVSLMKKREKEKKTQMEKSKTQHEPIAGPSRVSAPVANTALLNVDFGSQESSQEPSFSQASEVENANYVPQRSRVVFMEIAKNMIMKLEETLHSENLDQTTKDSLRQKVDQLNFMLYTAKLTSRVQEIVLKQEFTTLDKATLVSYLAISEKISPRELLKNFFDK